MTITAPPSKAGTWDERKPGGRRIDVVIGLDFGTARSKLGLRELRGRTTYVLGSSDPQVPAYVPSIVSIDRGRVYFGRSATAGELHLWLKMKLAQSARPDARDDLLAALFLGHLMAQGRDAATHKWGAGVSLTCNVGVPLTTLDEMHRALRLERAAYLGWRLAEEFPDELIDGLSLRMGETMVRRVDPGAELPAASERATSLVPEIHAAVTGAFQAGGLPDGHIAVIDIGAGTTDVSVVLHRRDQATFAYLGTEVFHRGGRDADAALAAAADSQWPGWARESDPPRRQEAMRVAKEGMTKNGLSVGNRRWSNCELAELLAPLTNELFKGYRRRWCEALLRKDKRALRTGTRHHLVMMGGGSRFLPIANAMAANPGPPNYDVEMCESGVALERELRLLHDDGDSTVHDGHLFNVCQGLADHIARLPEYWPPSAVEDQAPRQTFRYDTWMASDAWRD